MKAKQPTVESINQALSSGAKSLTDISRHHGYKGSVSGCLGDKIKALVPDVAERLKSNKSNKTKTDSPPVKQPAKSGGIFPRHSKNPFRKDRAMLPRSTFLLHSPKALPVAN
jgi:hypothetical protein